MAEYGRIHTDGSRSGGQPVLKPCPFCGGVQIKAFHHIDRGWGASWHVECVAEECGNSTCHHDTEATAIAAWNKRQPTHSNIFDACDVQKHTLIVEQDYASHTVKVKSLDDSQPTQSDALREAVIEECAKALEADAKKCDCFALEERECGCGAWCEWKSITSARAVEIVRALKE